MIWWLFVHWIDKLISYLSHLHTLCPDIPTDPNQSQLDVQLTIPNTRWTWMSKQSCSSIKTSFHTQTGLKTTNNGTLSRERVLRSMLSLDCCQPNDTKAPEKFFNPTCQYRRKEPQTRISRSTIRPLHLTQNTKSLRLQPDIAHTMQ